MEQKQLNIDFNAVAEIGRVGARRAAAFIAMGQKAWADETITSVTVETPFLVKLLPDPMPAELAKEVRILLITMELSGSVIFHRELISCRLAGENSSIP